MAIYTGVTVNFLGKRFGDWRFSWSYILGWVALLMTFFAGLFKQMSINAVLILNKISLSSYVNKTQLSQTGKPLKLHILTTAPSKNIYL